MKDSNVNKSTRDYDLVMNTAFGSELLPFRLDQALLAEGPVTVDPLAVVSECMAAGLGDASASFRQAAISTSFRIATAICEKRCKERVNLLLTQLHTLRELVENVAARLIKIKTPLERQPSMLYAPL